MKLQPDYARMSDGALVRRRKRLERWYKRVDAAYAAYASREKYDPHKLVWLANERYIIFLLVLRTIYEQRDRALRWFTG